MTHRFFTIHILLFTLLLGSCTIVKNYYILDGESITLESLKSARKAGLPGTGKEALLTYDPAPPLHIRKARLVIPATNYDPTNSATFPVYEDVHTVAAPLSGRQIDRVAIWCTDTATYVAAITEQYWGRHYFQLKSDTYIRDVKTGKRYYVISHEPFVLNQSYFLQAPPGQYNCTVAVFPPLPRTCTVIDIVEGDVTDVVKGAPGWGGGVKLRNVSVARLQANQYITEYKPVKVIE